MLRDRRTPAKKGSGGFPPNTRRRIVAPFGNFHNFQHSEAEHHGKARNYENKNYLEQGAEKSVSRIAMLLWIFSSAEPTKIELRQNPPRANHLH